MEITEATIFLSLEGGARDDDLQFLYVLHIVSCANILSIADFYNLFVSGILITRIALVSLSASALLSRV